MQWIWFAVGQVVNVFRQASLVASSTSNPINSTWAWVYRNLVGLAVREIFAISAWMLLTHPRVGEAIIAHWFPAYAKFASVLVELPFLAAPFGMLFSIMADYGMERFPWLKQHIPPLGE